MQWPRSLPSPRSQLQGGSCPLCWPTFAAKLRLRRSESPQETTRLKTGTQVRKYGCRRSAGEVTVDGGSGGAAVAAPEPQISARAVRREEQLESPATRHGEVRDSMLCCAVAAWAADLPACPRAQEAIFESHHPSQRFLNVLSQYR